jgi:1,4-dihydroxy-2-naphthoate octaprenyltransferase
MKSVITCDTEGVIKTMNTGAVKLFGYQKEEIIDKKRVSLFSPGEIVLQNVAGWLDKAKEEGKYEGKTIFVNKDGEKINAKIKITPLYGDGKDKPMTGYCGITEEIDEDVNVEIKSSTKFIKALAITRMPFVSAVIMPGLIGSAFVSAHLSQSITGFQFNTFFFVLCMIGLTLLHLGSNVMNDYFDVKDGTDDANNKYFTQYSGGSRAIELGLISLEGTRNLGLSLLAVSLFIGLFLTYNVGLPALYIGIAGLFLGYFYTAPPLRLVARRGLGELSILLAFGPLVTLGTAFILTQELALSSFLIGIPAGLLTANILLINQFPDAESDATTGKNHLVVTFGKEKSTWIYLSILLGSFVANLALWNAYLSTNIAYLSVSVLSFLFGFIIWLNIRKDYDKRELVKQNINTIALSALTGLATALAIWFG